MKDRSSDLRHCGGRHEARVLQANRARLEDEWSWNGGAVCAGDRSIRSAMHTLSERNWRITQYRRNYAVAIEPGRDYETPFVGPTAFWDAVEFAAKKLKEGS